MDDDQASRLREQLHALSEVIGAFANAAVDYELLLDTIARKLARVVGDLCSVLLVSEDGSSLQLVATYDPDPVVTAAARKLFDEGPVEIVPVQRRVLDTCEPLLVPQISPEMIRATTTAERAGLMEEIGMHSVMLVALSVGGRPIGLLNLVRHRPDRPGYDDLDRDLARSLAEHAAVAIANARRLQEQHDELRRAKEAAEEATRELETFSYSVAHDLRSPLRAIDGYSVALLEDYGSSLQREAADYISKIRANTRQMNRLIDALLDLARVSRRAMIKEKVDLSAIARDVIEGLRLHDPTRQVQASIANGLVVVGDAQLLRAMIDNLMRNAWKFTSKRDQGSIVFDRDGAGFKIEDNGAGFDMSTAQRLFTPFVRLHSDSEFAGTGIGLATVERVVNRHGGRVWAEAAVDRGAVFHFTLAPS